MSTELSATMKLALKMAEEHGGRLFRSPGGFWSYDGAPRNHNGSPEEWVGASTVEALVKRGRMAYTEWKKGRGFNFPVVAEIKPVLE